MVERRALDRMGCAARTVLYERCSESTLVRYQTVLLGQQTAGERSALKRLTACRQQVPATWMSKRRSNDERPFQQRLSAWRLLCRARLAR